MVFDPPELELHKVVDHHVVLRTEPRSSVIITGGLNC